MRRRPAGYSLIGHEPIGFDDVLAWARAIELLPDSQRVVGKTVVGGLEVSTVFLTVDHQWRLYAQPLLFETMVFGEGGGDLVERYSTWEQAERGHARCVESLRVDVEKMLEHGR